MISVLDGEVPEAVEQAQRAQRGLQEAQDLWHAQAMRHVSCISLEEIGGILVRIFCSVTNCLISTNCLINIQIHSSSLYIYNIIINTVELCSRPLVTWWLFPTPVLVWVSIYGSRSGVSFAKPFCCWAKPS